MTIIKRDLYSSKLDFAQLPFAEIEANYQAYYSVALSKNPEISSEDRAALASDVNKQVVEAFARQHKIELIWSSLGPQLLAYLATYKLPSHKDISAREFLNLNVLNRPRDLGLWRLITKVPRGTIMTKQTSRDNIGCCGLVPLYMAAQKQFNGVAYNDWSREEIHLIVDKTLAKAITFEFDPTVEQALTPDNLLQLRNIGLTRIIKGKETKLNPLTTYQLYGLSDTVLAGVPPLVKCMLTQTWCAHPDNRHKYMILDIKDWDHMPEPLISTEVLTPAPKQKINYDREYSVPWDE